MVRKFTIIALAGALTTVAAAPAFADDVMTPVTTTVTTVTDDITKGLAGLDPVAILTPKPIEAPAAAAPAKVKKKKHFAKKRMMKKKMKKA